MGLVVVAAAERQIRPLYRRLADPAKSTEGLTIEIWFSLRIRISPPQAMDRCDSQMEAANPGDRFGSHAEIFVELRDQMTPAASEFLRQPRQIDIGGRLLEYPP